VVQVAALLPTREVHRPLGCHPRIPDRIVVDKLDQVLMFGYGYRRIADHSCSATLRRRRDECITLGRGGAAVPGRTGRLASDPAEQDRPAQRRDAGERAQPHAGTLVRSARFATPPPRRWGQPVTVKSADRSSTCTW
jgi:hypothetical protein